jgi:hypothetical protein
MAAKICHDTDIISNIKKKISSYAARVSASFRKAIKLIVIVV